MVPSLAINTKGSANHTKSIVHLPLHFHQRRRWRSPTHAYIDLTFSQVAAFELQVDAIVLAATRGPVLDLYKDIKGCVCCGIGSQLFVQWMCVTIAGGSCQQHLTYNHREEFLSKARNTRADQQGYLRGVQASGNFNCLGKDVGHGILFQSIHVWNVWLPCGSLHDALRRSHKFCVPLDNRKLSPESACPGLLAYLALLSAVTAICHLDNIPTGNCE